MFAVSRKILGIHVYTRWHASFDNLNDVYQKGSARACALLTVRGYVPEVSFFIWRTRACHGHVLFLVAGASSLP